MRSALVQRGGLLVAAGFGLLAAAAPVRAAPPTADDFQIRYWLTDASGAKDRLFSQADHRYLVNQARCECGHKILAEVRLAADAQLDPATLIQTFVGGHCDVAEIPTEGQFRRCAELAATTAPTYSAGVEVGFHPVWLNNGLAFASPTRAPNDPEALAEGTCKLSQGESGVYMCAETNGAALCQQDEFFVRPAAEGDPVQTAIVYDFLPPVQLATELAAEWAGTDVRLSWTLDAPGDIWGMRVLCEEAATGMPAVRVQEEVFPGLTDVPVGDFYVNAHNLCGGEPFSTVTMVGEPAGAGGCGDGFVDDGEECDDGEDNADDGLCSSACTLNVSAGLHALDWSYLCSPHLRFDASSWTTSNLELGKVYNFVLVVYDRSGNPRAVPQVVTFGVDGDRPAPPDLGCGCRSTTGDGAAGLVLVALALAGRRRRRA